MIELKRSLITSNVTIAETLKKKRKENLKPTPTQRFTNFIANVTQDVLISQRIFLLK